MTTPDRFIDLAELRKAAELFVGVAPVVELRTFNATVPGLNGRYPVKTIVGYFDTAAALVEQAQRIQSADGCYVTLNRVDPKLLARAANKLRKADRGGTTSDLNVQRRLWLFIDLDAGRPAGISASDDEHEAARKRARSIFQFLKARGWPDPVVADSGNGCHLLYRIDLPADDGGIVERCLHALERRFRDDLVKVDCANHNPSRICKLYGTRAAKGDSTPDRPHRMSRLLSVPDELAVVPRELLEALAAEHADAGQSQSGPRVSKVYGNGTFDIEQFIRDARLDVDGPEDWTSKAGRGRRWVMRVCPFNSEHDRGEAYILELGSGALSAGCQHESCQWGWDELRARYQPKQERNGTAGNAAGGSDDITPKKSQATLLVELGKGTELWHTPGQGDAYATLCVNGHLEHWPVRSRTFKRWLCRQYYSQHRTTPGSQSVQDALGVLEGEALFAGKTYSPAVRVGEHDGRLFLDLCDGAWQSVEIDADGWRLMKRCPVRFRRAKAMLPLTVPRPGGDLQELRRFVNATDDDWPLLLGWLAACFRPTGPYPILCLHGEQGSSKTTTARVLRAIVDPNTAPVRCEPREPRDLMIAASNGWIVATDNLSRVPGWLSDALCRLATGGGFSTRTLYENDEEQIFNAQRPSILTGIEELATRSDLLDRSILVNLPRIGDDQRRPESDFWPAFNAALPGILGATLDAVSVAIRNLPTTPMGRLPRMADFALWVTAAEPGLGLAPGQFLESYRDNRTTAHAQAMESCPVVPYVMDLGEWSGRPTELLTKLNGMASDADRKLTGWPKTPRGLSGMLRRLAPDLRAVGVDVAFGREPGGQRRRFIQIRLVRESSVPTDPTDPDPEEHRPGPGTVGTQTPGPGRTGDANGVDVNPDGATAGTVRDGRDDELQPQSSDRPDLGTCDCGAQLAGQRTFDGFLNLSCPVCGKCYPCMKAES